MRNLKEAKEIYDHIVVPEELDARLRKADGKGASAAGQPPQSSPLSGWSDALPEAVPAGSGSPGREDVTV